jgi:hypothetical protein
LVFIFQAQSALPALEPTLKTMKLTQSCFVVVDIDVVVAVVVFFAEK